MIPRFNNAQNEFDIVGVNFAAHVLALRVLYGFMADAASKVVVALILIGRDERDLFVDGMADESGQRASISLPNDLADHVAFAFDSSDHTYLAIADFVAELIRTIGFALLAGFLAQWRFLSFPPM